MNEIYLRVSYSHTELKVVCRRVSRALRFITTLYFEGVDWLYSRCVCIRLLLPKTATCPFFKAPDKSETTESC